MMDKNAILPDDDMGSNAIPRTSATIEDDNVNALNGSVAELENREEYVRNNKFHVVGIGASAGGFEALEQFFSGMPSDSGMAFVVVQHLSPDYKSLMVELLSKHTRMKVLQAVDGMDLEQNRVYLIPPKKIMTVFHDKLFLEDKEAKNSPNFPIDIFFNSLAEDQREMAIAIILSGTGSDGSRGIRAIKQETGMVMVQEPGSAKFDGMPRNAISTGLADFILPANRMPEELLKYVKQPVVAYQKDGKQIVRDEDRLVKIFSYLKNYSGVDFTYYKQSTVMRRIERRMSINRLENIEDYINFLFQNPSEASTLYKELLIGVTKFFRDTEAFELLKNKVLPEIFIQKDRLEPIRIWSVGCSTGEEPYSLAMLFKEYMGIFGIPNEVKIFATDIDRNALEFAGAGRYPENISADLSMERLRTYFTKREDKYVINKQIREMVIFAPHNIIKDPPFNKIDLLVCRNLLIYLQPILQQKVISHFNFALNYNGFLLLGPSETVGELAGSFTNFDSKWKIYRSIGKNKPLIMNEMGSLLHSTRKEPETIAAYGATKAGDEKGMEAIFEVLLGKYLPPCIIINENRELVHVCGNVDRYVKFPEGRVVLNISRLIRKDLTGAVDAAIHRVLRERRETVYSGMVLSDGPEKINLIVKPFDMGRHSPKLLLIIFEKAGWFNGDAEEKDKSFIDDAVQKRIKDLEYELQYTKESLQASLEEVETTNEELQATNEELLSSNEELQSTNEELQSVNEELITVNSEYQSKIQELTDLNNDMNNLLTSTNIGTVFLDHDLCVRKFTPAVTEEINLIEHDIGRPITHISWNIKYPNLVNDAAVVLKTLIPKETEVESNRGKWLLTRILPYRTLENVIKGVVITFIDITVRKKAEESLHREHEMMRRITQTSPAAIISFDLEGRVLFANKRAENMFGMTEEQWMGVRYDTFPMAFFSLEEKLLPAERRPFRQVLSTAAPVFDARMIVVLQNGKRMVISVNSAPLLDQNGKMNGVVSTAEDITSMYERRRELESLVKERTSALGKARYFIDSIDAVFLALDVNGNVSMINRKGREVLGLLEEEIQGRNWFDLFLPGKDREAVREKFREMMQGTLVLDFFENRILTADEREIEVSWHNKLMFDENGRIIGVLSSGKIME